MLKCKCKIWNFLFFFLLRSFNSFDFWEKKKKLDFSDSDKTIGEALSAPLELFNSFHPVVKQLQKSFCTYFRIDLLERNFTWIRSDSGVGSWPTVFEQNEPPHIIQNPTDRDSSAINRQTVKKKNNKRQPFILLSVYKQHRRVRSDKFTSTSARRWPGNICKSSSQWSHPRSVNN